MKVGRKYGIGKHKLMILWIIKLSELKSDWVRCNV